MKIKYFSDTDSLYISLLDEIASESEEIAPGVVADFTSDGRLVGIGIDKAGDTVDLTQLVTEGVFSPSPR